MENKIEREYTVSRNPYTGEVLGKFPINTKDEVFEAINRAKRAQKSWEQTPIEERIKQVRKIQKYLVQNAQLISQEISMENGKTKTDALATEVLPATIAIDYYCKNAKRFLKDKKIHGGNILLFNKKSKIIKSPYGVVGIISPWNYPFAIPFSEIIKAILAGNAVVLKTASISQLVGNRIKACIEAGELPENIFTLLNLSGKYAGDYFIEGGIDKLFFTGSVNTGKYLMKKAAEKLLPVSLELGGNDPMIVLKDADLDRAAWGTIWAGFQNSGQSCGGIERVYVQKEIYKTYLETLKNNLEKLKIGAVVSGGSDQNTEPDIGGLTTEQQYRTVEEHVKDAIEHGATIYYQHKITPETKKYNLIFPPTILTNVNHSMKVMIDETFGPVIGVMSFNDIEEAIVLANDSYLGLTASIWTKNRKLAQRLARKIQAGVITINDHLMSHGLAETPWGGIKQSGIGKTHGKMGFEEMLQHKVVVDDILHFAKKDLWWHPYNQKLYNGLEGAIYALYGKGILSKITGWTRVIGVFFRIFKK